MANEVAALGLKVDPSGITEGIKALDDLAARGPKAEKAMNAVGESATKASKSLKTLGQGSAKGLEDVGQAAPKAAESVGRLSKSAESANSSLSKISTSAAGLGKVATASTQSARSAESLSASLAQTQKTIAQMQMQLQTASAATANFGKAQSDAARNATNVASAYKAAGQQVSAYARAPEQAAVANQRLSKSMEATASAARLISSAFAISGIGLGASQIIALSDGYTKFTAQLKLATKSASDYAVAMGDVQRIAYGAQAGISEVGTLYARIANGTAELGLSQQRLADITEVVALSLKVSGATAAESSSAMLQLSQAFASGVLRGEEFNAVNESAPRLMKALAEGIGVPIGALRKMAEEGQLTSKVLAEALPKALEKVRTEADKIQTIGGAFTNLNSKMMEFVGGAGEASGAAKAIANSVLLVADNLGVVTTAFGAAALVMSGRYVGALTAAAAAKRAAAVAATEAAIATTAASRAALAGSTSFQAMGASATTATFGVTAMAGATRAAGAALAFFGGPIGLAITALGVAASAFLYLRDSSEEAIKSIGGLNQPLDDLKKKLDELPPERRISILIDVEKSGKEAVRDAQKSIEDLTNFVRVFGNYTLPAEEVRKYTDELQKTAAAGGDLTPVLKRAAEAGQVPQKVLQRWLDLAANIREARSAAANAEAALAAAGTNVGGGRGTINPPTIAEMNASARAEAQSVLQATTAYKSKAEQIAELRGQEDKLQSALNGLISTNQGASKSADDLRLRLSGVADRMAGLQKSTSSGAGAIKDTENAYKSLSNRVAEYIAQLQQEVAQGGKVTNSQKMQIQLDELLASSKSKVSKAALQALQNSIKTAAGLEQEAAAAENAAKAYEEGLKWKAEWYAAQGKNLEEIKSANNRIREEIQLIGLSQDAQQALERARIEATLAVREQHLAEMQRANDANQFSSRDQQNLEMEIALLKERLGLLDDKRVRTANVEAAKELEKQWNKTSQTIGDTLADYIMGGGKDAATYLKRLFSTLVLEPVVKTVVGNAMGGIGLGGAKGGVAGGFDLLSAGKGLFDAWSGSTGGMLATAVSGLGSLTSSVFLGELGSAIAAGVELGISGAAALTSSASATTTTGMWLGAAAPWVAGIGALLSIVPSFLNGGTPHVGAAARYAGGGINASGAAFTSQTAVTHTYEKAMQAPVDLIVTTLGNSLDSISELFGGKRGFSVTAGFSADNDDPSAGLLNIFDPDNNQPVRWTAGRFGSLTHRRNSRFSSDPKEGFNQYLQSVTADVIPVFKDIVPGWADDLLTQLSDSLGVTQAIESGDPYAWQQMTASGQEAFQALQNTLAQIAQIDAAFDALGKTMVVFADMTDEMKSALLGGLGGIEGFSAAAQTYYASYYSEQERYTEALARMQEVLAGIGVDIDPAMGSEAKAQYRALIETAFADGNEELATQLLALSGAFAQTADAAQEQAQAQAQAQATLMQSTADLLSRLPGGVADARDMQAAVMAQQASTIWGGIDVAALQSTILSVNAQELEAYLREAWAAADTVGAKQAVVDFGLAMTDFIGDVMRDLLTERKQLEAEMLRASGDDAGYAQALRAIATEGYTEAEVAAWDYNQALRAQVQAQEDAARQQLATARKVVEAQRQLAMDAAATVREQISAVQSRIRELESEADWVRTQAGMGYGQAGVGAADKFTASLYSGYEGYAANMAALAQQYDGMAQAQKDMLAELETEESRHKGTVQRLESILSEGKAQVAQLMSLNAAIGVLQSAVVGAINGSGTVEQPSPPVAPVTSGGTPRGWVGGSLRETDIVRMLSTVVENDWGEAIYGEILRDYGKKFNDDIVKFLRAYDPAYTQAYERITGKSTGGADSGAPDSALGQTSAPELTIADYKQLAQLQQQYWQLLGDEEAIRAATLAAMHPQLQAMQQMIWSIGDLQDAAQNAAQSMSTAWASVGTASGWAAEYLGDSSGLESMLATMRESYDGAQTVQQREAALGQIINLEQQLFNLEQKRQEGAIEAAQKAADAAREQLEAVRNTLQAAQALGDYAQKMMYGEQSGLSDADRFAALGTEYESLLARARSGDAEAMQALSGVTSDYLGLAQELAVSQADYSVLSGRIAAELAATAVVQEASAKTQEDMLRAKIDSAQEQIKALQKQFEVSNKTKALIDQQLTDAQAQFKDQQAKVQELINQGADTNRLLSALPGELGGVILPAINAATAASQAAAAARSAGYQTTVNSWAGGSSATRIQSSSGDIVLDVGGDWSQERVAEQVKSNLAAYKQLGESENYDALLAYARSKGIPALAVGTNYVPRDMLAQIHEGEAVLPKAFNPWAGGGRSMGGGAAEHALVAEIRALREQNARLEERLQGIERSNQQLADQFDNVTVGGNAMAVEVMA